MQPHCQLATLAAHNEYAAAEQCLEADVRSPEQWLFSSAMNRPRTMYHVFTSTTGSPPGSDETSVTCSHTVSKNNEWLATDKDCRKAINLG